MPLKLRLPKRGFTQMPRHPFAEVNVDVLQDHFNDGDEITAEKLLDLHLIKDLKGGIKILGRGELTKKLSVKTNAISGTAREKVEGAGGAVETIEIPTARAVKNRKKGKARK